MAEKHLMRLADLNPHPQNPNRHQPQEVALIRQSLRRWGVYKPLVVWYSQEDKRWYTLTGHCVAEAAAQEGIEQVWVEDRSDLTPAQALALMAADNEIARHLSYPDDDDLSQLVAAVHAEDASLAELAAGGEAELRRLLEMAGQEPKAEDEGAQLDRAEELQGKWKVATGDLWIIPSKTVKGEHRIVCGDCTDAAVVERVMQGEKAALIVTSPPYPDAEMWEMKADDLIALGFTAMQICFDLTHEGGVMCWNTADVPRGNDGMAPNTARDTLQAYEIGWKKRGDIIWWKGMSYLPLSSFTRRPTIPNCTHESLLVFVKGDWRPRDAEGLLTDEQMSWNRDSVWKIGTESAQAMGHKAPFPLELPDRCVTLWSLNNDIVLDPFLGSGTTLAACERLGRRGRGIEVHPPYVSVCLERLSQMGLTPVLQEHI